MTKVLQCCDNCIGRERKRAHRRKETQKLLPGPLASIPVFGAINRKNSSVAAALAHETNPPTPTDPIAHQAWERSRIMVFSSTEYVDISTGECVLPTRITCYCRHHNEKVGFRIQFTARDFTGAIVASVLTNPVMMMDDHKSGKRGVTSDKTTTVKNNTIQQSLSTSTLMSNCSNSGHDDLRNIEDIDDDDYALEDQDDLDLEAGHYTKSRYTGLRMNIDADDYDADTDQSSPDLKAFQESTGRMAAKRRVADEDLTMEDFQIQQQHLRRKTSHDTQYSNSSFAYSIDRDSALLSPSPFMPGSPFAIDEEHNAFAPSFGQAMTTSGRSLLDHQQSYNNNNDSSMFTFFSQRTGSIQSPNDLVEQEKLNAESSVSLMGNFTTLDESIPSATNEFQTPSVLTAGLNSTIPSDNQFSSRSSSISTPMTSTMPLLYQSLSPYSSNNFQTPSSLGGDEDGSGLSASFLDIVQMQEFQNLQRQNFTQQQQFLLQIQQQQQQQSSLDSNSLRSMNPTSPSSEAFIPIPASLPDNVGADFGSSSINDDLDASALARKKRGRPRKSLTALTTLNMPSTPSMGASTSGASSPMTSPRAPSTNMPPSPSPPPFLGHESTSSTPLLTTAVLAGSSSSSSLNSLECVPSTSAAAAAHFLLFHQQQQQLQQQQKQAILARQPHHNHPFQGQQLHQQKPRVQKLIPTKGSVEGGEEITLLGTGFFPGMVPTFDGVPAIGVQFFGSETIVCRLPPRACPGVVIVKAHQQQQANNLMNNGGTTSSSSTSSVKSEDEGSSSGSELVRAMSQFFGGSSAASLSMPNDYDFEDQDVGVLFEYEEDKGDRDLIALALQVLGMKMNGRVESPHQVAMRIMATASAHQQQLAEQQKQQRQQLQLQAQPQRLSLQQRQQQQQKQPSQIRHTPQR
ncbi:hypothetical protein BGZ49_001509, partial [Haplosporangium sp. Z 27]